MAELGRYNRLRVLRRTDIGIFLDGGRFGEILLPRKYVLDSMQPGDEVEVFLYNDSEDRIVATTLVPQAQVGECAYLKVVSTGKFGAFLDWGLPKDLLVPFSEQHKPMQKGYSYTVYLFVDDATQRIAASTKLENHLSQDGSGFKPRQAVDLLIYGKSDLGFKAVVNGTHLGQLYDNETFRRLHFGEVVKGYIKQLRSDGKIDLTLQLPSHLERDELSNAIIEHLQQNKGSSDLTDNSPPDDIYRTFGVSKASYKKALGQLYKQRRIMIDKHRIVLL
ncbi:MAG: S1-like domain-containing RNA-binding protein [Gammaproteobacteria bacterium]|nr:S1-like domain-containing RNA-binding protein [Gammaproteobacteria bacterium]MDH3447761.1 S1-like domain-containing RNA-binding protein [Gammaproteobacteria bacterium]